jgi:hypothetical protein
MAVDKQEGAATPPSTSKRAECGWGCFCDACWLAAGERSEAAEERTQAERFWREVDALTVLVAAAGAFDVGSALPGLEAAAQRERLRRAGDASAGAAGGEL